MAIETFTNEMFSGQLNTKFRVMSNGAAALELELLELEDFSQPGQVQFAIRFRGPLATFLEQRIYHLEHDVLGEMDIFLVPIAREADGFRYEAVFNRFVQA